MAAKQRKPIFVGTDFYKKKGLDKTVTVHLSKSVYERLRDLAHRKHKGSLQKVLRALIEQNLPEK